MGPCPLGPVLSNPGILYLLSLFDRINYFGNRFLIVVVLHQLDFEFIEQLLGLRAEVAGNDAPGIHLQHLLGHFGAGAALRISRVYAAASALFAVSAVATPMGVAVGTDRPTVASD